MIDTAEHFIEKGKIDGEEVNGEENKKKNAGKMRKVTTNINLTYQCYRPKCNEDKRYYLHEYGVLPGKQL